MQSRIRHIKYNKFEQTRSNQHTTNEAHSKLSFHTTHHFLPHTLTISISLSSWKAFTASTSLLYTSPSFFTHANNWLYSSVVIYTSLSPSNPTLPLISSCSNVASNKDTNTFFIALPSVRTALCLASSLRLSYTPGWRERISQGVGRVDKLRSI